MSWCLPVDALLTDLSNLSIAMMEELEQLGNRTTSAKIRNRNSHIRANDHDGWPTSSGSVGIVMTPKDLLPQVRENDE